MDWKKLILEIIAAGMSQSAIADRMKKSQAWVSAISKNKFDDLKYSDGEALIALRLEQVRASAKKELCDKRCDSCPNHQDCDERRRSDRRALEKLIQLRRKDD